MSQQLHLNNALGADLCSAQPCWEASNTPPGCPNTPCTLPSTPVDTLSRESSPCSQMLLLPEKACVQSHDDDNDYGLSGLGAYPLQYEKTMGAQVLGSGAIGEVVKVADNDNVGMAVKKIKLRNVRGMISPAPHERELRVFQILSNHQLHSSETKATHIVNYVGAYLENGYFYLVLELCEGGDLFNFVTTRGAVSDAAACTIMKQLLTALTFCHTCNIAHRDVKPSNILLKGPFDKEMTKASAETGEGGKPEIRLCDFENSSFLIKDFVNKRMPCGTTPYTAPERRRCPPTPHNTSLRNVVSLATDASTTGDGAPEGSAAETSVAETSAETSVADVEEGYEKCDSFSAGIVLLFLLTREHADESTFDRLLSRSDLSCDSLDLARKLLRQDRRERISCHEALKHRWFNDVGC